MSLRLVRPDEPTPEDFVEPLASCAGPLGIERFTELVTHFAVTAQAVRFHRDAQRPDLWQVVREAIDAAIAAEQEAR